MSRPILCCGTVTYCGCLFADVVMVPVLLLTLGPCLWRLVDCVYVFFCRWLIQGSRCCYGGSAGSFWLADCRNGKLICSIHFKNTSHFIRYILIFIYYSCTTTTTSIKVWEILLVTLRFLLFTPNWKSVAIRALTRVSTRPTSLSTSLSFCFTLPNALEVSSNFSLVDLSFVLASSPAL